MHFVFFQIISCVLWVVVSPPVTSPLLSPARSDEVTAPEPEDTRMASPAVSLSMLHKLIKFDKPKICFFFRSFSKGWSAFYFDLGLIKVLMEVLFSYFLCIYPSVTAVRAQAECLLSRVRNKACSRLVFEVI